MPRPGKSTPDTAQAEQQAVQTPRSNMFAARGIKTSGDFAGMMSALMSDVLEGRVTPQVSNAVVNSGGKLLKMIELQFKYGKPSADGQQKELRLIPVND